MVEYSKVLELRTNSSGNIRVYIASDSMNLCVQYKYEESNDFIDNYILFKNVLSFSYKRQPLLISINGESYDCVCERKGSGSELPVGIKSYECFFSEHGLLEVSAEEVEALESAPPTLADIFNLMIGDDLQNH